LGSLSTLARADHVHPTDTSRAPTVSPTFTGTVVLPSGQALIGPEIVDFAAFIGSTSGATKLVATAVAGSTVLTLPAATDILVGRNTADTLTNKTLNAPTITGAGAIAGVFTGNLTGNVIGNATTSSSTTGNAATATKIASITNANIVQLTTTQTLSGKTLTAPIIGSGATFVGGTSGAIKLQATAVAGNNILTLPAETGTLATIGGTETLEGKTLTSPVITSPTGLVKGDVGLGNVDNTSNATERAAAATLTNKTLTTPIISSISNTGTLTLPTSTDTLVGRDTADILTNKTLTSPTLETPILGTPQSGDLTNCTGTFQQITGITVSQASWNEDSGLYESDISNANITSNTVVDVIPDNADYTIVLAAQLLPANVSSAGAVKIFAVNEPTDDINVTLNLFK
jgi:hypothetical protein